jgi:hypothetical protein
VSTAAGEPAGALGASTGDSVAPGGVAAVGGDGGTTTPGASAQHDDRRLVKGLAALAALGVAGAVGFGIAWAESSGGTPTDAVTSGARNVVLALTNFDPGTVSSDFTRIQQDSTGTFATQARKYFGTSIRKELTAAHAASRGKIVDLYVQSVSGNQATVFAVVDQTYLNSAAKSPVTDVLRLVIGLTDMNGTWKASSVQVLQQPVGTSSSGSGTAGSSGSSSASGGGTASGSSGTGTTVTSKP